MSELREFQHGFFGASGRGAGKHLNSEADVLDATLINRIENAIVNLYNIEQANGMYGSFRMSTITGYMTEIFSGDGTTTGFTLSKGISKWDVYRYDIYSDDPYINGILPTGLGGELVDFDSNTKLSNTLYFTTAPASGTNNIKVKYYLYSNKTSRLNGGSRLNDWMEA